MHILFIGYGKTASRLAKSLAKQHYITTISRSLKTDRYAVHLQQDVHALDLSKVKPIDAVYVLLAPDQSDAASYQHTYLESVSPICKALSHHPVKKIFVLSSTRVYGQSSGEPIDDETEVCPCDLQGEILLNMEQTWRRFYPEICTIIRPTGIYGTSVKRMLDLAKTRQTYPNIHYSNRIHIQDLVNFLAFLLEQHSPLASYIVSDNRPIALHEIIQWFQQQLGISPLILDRQQVSGKRVFATRMQAQQAFQLQHPDCFTEYLNLLRSEVF